jgi:molecular chaperone GrpE
LRDLLPIWDNMGRAVEAAEKAGEADALLEGFKMVYTQLTGVFEQYHCVKIDPAGEPFDPNLHEAISQMPSADHPSGTVLHVVQVGFQLHERVVRPCQVVVSATPPTPSPAETGGDQEGTPDAPADEDQS